MKTHILLLVQSSSITTMPRGGGENLICRRTLSDSGPSSSVRDHKWDEAESWADELLENLTARSRQSHDELKCEERLTNILQMQQAASHLLTALVMPDTHTCLSLPPSLSSPAKPPGAIENSARPAALACTQGRLEGGGGGAGGGGGGDVQDSERAKNTSDKNVCCPALPRGMNCDLVCPPEAPPEGQMLEMQDVTSQLIRMLSDPHILAATSEHAHTKPIPQPRSSALSCFSPTNIHSSTFPNTGEESDAHAQTATHPRVDFPWQGLLCLKTHRELSEANKDADESHSQVTGGVSTSDVSENVVRSVDAGTGVWEDDKEDDREADERKMHDVREVGDTTHTHTHDAILSPLSACSTAKNELEHDETLGGGRGVDGFFEPSPQSTSHNPTVPTPFAPALRKQHYQGSQHSFTPAQPLVQLPQPPLLSIYKQLPHNETQSSPYKALRVTAAA